MLVIRCPKCKSNNVIKEQYCVCVDCDCEFKVQISIVREQPRDSDSYIFESLMKAFGMA